MSNVCPHCQAQNQSGVTRCWMCGEWLGGDAIITAEVVGQGDERSAGTYVVTALLVIVALVAVAAGLWREAPGLSVLLCLVAAPAVLITLIQILRRRGRGEKITGGRTAMDFFLTTLVVGIIAAVVAIIACVCLAILFFIVCVRMFGNI